MKSKTVDGSDNPYSCESMTCEVSPRERPKNHWPWMCFGYRAFLPKRDAARLTENLRPYSCKTTVSSHLLMLIFPLYSMKPSFLNLFMKKFTRERVVPIIFARVS